MTTRRIFFESCLTAVAGFAMLPWVAAGGTRSSLRFMPLDKLAFKDIACHVNTTFHVRHGDQLVLPLELIEAREQPQPQIRRGPDADFEKFSLLFSGPLLPVLEQRIHTFEHPSIGRFEMFMVPVMSRDKTRMHYECVFNRPRVERA